MTDKNVAFRDFAPGPRPTFVPRFRGFAHPWGNLPLGIPNGGISHTCTCMHTQTHALHGPGPGPGPGPGHTQGMHFECTCAYVCLSIYIRRPLLVRGDKAARRSVAITVFQSWFLLFINLLFSSPGSCYFLLSSLQLSVCQSGILTYSCLGFSNLGLVTVYWTPGTGVNPNLTVLPRFVMVPGGSLKSIKFQPVSRTLPNHQSVTPSTQKPPKMRSQDVPEHPRIANQPKKWNLTKPSVFTMLSAHRSIVFWCDCHLQIT